MLRITTGLAKNIKLKTPSIPDFKAVQEVAKSSIFSIIGDKVINACCLDLYAGSGNLGLEAISRGAAYCDFVDKHPEAKKAILENISKCKFENKTEFLFKDSVKYVANTMKKYDLIFVDPFYERMSHIFLLKNLYEILALKGLIIFFHGENLILEDMIKDTALKIVDSRRFGKSYFSLLVKTD